VNFNLEEIKKCVKKDFKGLVAHQFDEPLDENIWVPFVVSPIDSQRTKKIAGQLFTGYLENDKFIPLGLHQVFAYQGIIPMNFFL